MATPSWKDLLSTFDTPNAPLRPNTLQADKCPEFRRAHIIYTNTYILARKYMISEDTVIRALDAYITSERERGNQWFLLDVAVSNLKRPELYKHNEWESYQNYLSSFLHKNRIISDIHTSVFIIGGDDVIPIPRYRIPIDDAPIEFEVEMDMFYCFKPGVKVTAFLNTVKAAETGGEKQVFDHIQCNIGRLPIEVGDVSLPFQNSVISYLKRCSDTNTCIRVNNSVNVSVSDWATATEFIVSGIPSALHGFENSFVNNRMFTVPTYSINEQAMRAYFEQASQKCDMALFNLHGASEFACHQYYGDNGAEAFSPDLAEKCKAKLICSLACYGARHTGYSMNSSILLSAIWHNCLLFIGSCQASFFNTGRRGFCEILIKEFLLNLFKGIPAGEALLMAKISYLLKYWPMDNFSSAYLTIGEFNIFGNPDLVIKTERIDVDKFDLETKSIDFHIANTPDIFCFTNTAVPELDNVYTDVIDEVNNAMMDIEHRLSNQLNTEFSLDNVKLCRSLRQKNNQGISRYKFIYTFGADDKGVAIVKTDRDGKIVDFVRTR